VKGLRLDDFDDDDVVQGDGVGDIADGMSTGPLSPLGSHAPEGEWDDAYDEDELEAIRDARCSSLSRSQHTLATNRR
jgi:hypothetical protein